MAWVVTSWELLGPAIAVHSCITAKEYEAILQKQVHSVLQMLLLYDIPVLQGDYFDIHTPDSDITTLMKVKVTYEGYIWNLSSEF